MRTIRQHESALRSRLSGRAGLWGSEPSLLGAAHPGWGPFPTSLPYPVQARWVVLGAEALGFREPCRKPPSRLLVSRGGLGSWAKGDFFQLRLNKDNSGPYVVVYKKGNWGTGKGLTGYVIGESKVNLTIKVGPEVADFYYDGNLLTSIPRADWYRTSGVPYFESHPNCAFELDNLTVYSGIGEPSTAVTPVISQIDPANAPTMRGYQLSTQTYTKDDNEVFDIRFVASGDAMNRQNVGFIVTADAQEKAWNENTTSVFSSLSAETSEGIPCQPITASQYEANYVCAMAVKAIPVGTSITFCVTPYATDLNGNLIYGTTVHYTVNVPATT